MRLPTCIDNPQSNRPLSRHAHFGRSKAKILRHDVDRLLRRITAHQPQNEQGDKSREGKRAQGTVDTTGHGSSLASFQWRTLQCRFMTSGLERAIPLAGLYVILDPSVRPDRPLMEVLNAAAAGHVRIFQYRNKTASTKDALTEAGPLRRRARELNVLFLVNDRCDLALAINADGVHLGQSDLPYLKARQLLGEQKYIGLSTHNAGQVKEAEQLRPDYIGFGPIFTPASKTDHDPVVGVEGLTRVRALTSLPVFAIGGIQTQHVRPLMEAGANGIAVISAVCGAPDITAAAARFTEQMT